MTYIPPLELQTWFQSVFAGNPEILAAIALLVVTSMAAMFRMNGIGLFFVLIMFLLIFSGLINSVLLILGLIIGGLVLGYVLYKVFVE